MKYEVFLAVKTLIVAFWIMMLCSIIVGYQGFGRTHLLHLMVPHVDGMFLQNVVHRLLVYTAS
jgi:hypothetical protein